METKSRLITIAPVLPTSDLARDMPGTRRKQDLISILAMMTMLCYAGAIFTSICSGMQTRRMILCWVVQ